MSGLFSRAFVGYLGARIAIGVANTMLTVALGWHLYEITGDPWSLALVGLMQIIPVTGLIADRFFQRPRLIVVIASTIGVGMVAFTFLQALRGQPFI